MTKIPIVSVRQSTLLIDGAEKSVKQKKRFKIDQIRKSKPEKIARLSGQFFHCFNRS